MNASFEIALRPWHQKDVARLVDLRNDQALQELLLARVRGSDEAQVLQWLRDRTSVSDSLFFVVAAMPLDQCIGYIQIVGIDWIDRRGDLGICLEPGRQAQGLGTQSLHLLADRLRTDWAIRKLSLRVRSDNLRAIRCYERSGFAHCGVQKRHVYLDGAWQDVVLMERFLDE